MIRAAAFILLTSVRTAYARGRWGDDYDGNGPFWGPYYGSNSNIDGFGDSFGTGIGIDFATASRYRLIHGILAALAFVGLFPIGAILMRVVPGRLSYIVHGIVQVFAYLVYVAGAGLGIYLVKMVRIPPTGQSMLSIPQANAHPIIGLVVLAVLFFQPALGVIHHIRYKRVGSRTVWSYAHLWVGRLAITLGIINGGLGLALAQAGRNALTAYAVIGAIMWLLWVAAALFGARKRSKAAAASATAAATAKANEASANNQNQRLHRNGSRNVQQMEAFKPGRRDSYVSSDSSRSRR